MAQENTTVFTVDTSSGQKSLKDLRKDVAELRDSLATLDRGSEKYNATLAQIGETQRTINTITNDVNESIKGTADALKTVTTKDYRNEINSLRESLLGLDRDSDEYLNTLNKIGALQQELNTINGDVRASSADLATTLANVAQVGSGLAGGLSSLNGLIALTGSESEELNAVMVKLQAGIAIVQGLQGIQGMIKAIPTLTTGFKLWKTSINATTASVNGLKKALIATGIGALIVLIGVLIANLDKLINLFTKNKERAEENRKAYENLQRTISSLNKEADLNVRILQAQGATEEEIIKARRDSIKAIIAQTQAEIDRIYALGKLSKAEKKILEDLRALESEYYEKLKAANNDASVLEHKRVKEAGDAKKKEIDDRIAAERKAAEEARKIREQELANVESINDDIRRSYLTEQQLELEDLTTAYNERLALLEKYGEDTAELTLRYNLDIQEVNERYRDENIEAMLAAAEDERTRAREISDARITDADLNLSKELAQLRTQLLSREITTEQYNAAVLEKESAYFEQKYILRQDAYNREVEQLQIQLDNELLTEEQRYELRLQMTDALNGLRDLEIEKIEEYNEALQRSVDDERRLEAQRKKIKESALSTASSIGKSLATLLGEQTAAGKAAAVTAATIDTYQAANSAYAALAGIPIVGPGLGAAAAAAAIVAGLANVKQILKADSSGSAATATVTAPAVTTAIIQPTANILTAEEQAEYNQSSKVYVTETDISDTANRVRTAETEARF